MNVEERGGLRQRGVVGGVCPHCGAGLARTGADGSGGPIAFETEDHRGTLYYACPVCHLAWTGVSGGGPLAELAARHVVDHNRGVQRAGKAEPRVRETLERSSGDVEGVLERAGASAPLGWAYGPWAPLVTLFVVQQWCCLNRSDAELTWMRAEDRLTWLVGCPVLLQELTAGGVRAMTCLQALAGAEPWGGVEPHGAPGPAWARGLVETMRRGRITWPELSAQMDLRLRAASAE